MELPGSILGREPSPDGRWLKLRRQRWLEKGVIVLPEHWTMR